MTYIIPGSEPFYLPGGLQGCLLLHGFSATPEEMRLLGDFLSDHGFTVMGLRLAGHGTHPNDLKRTRWNDWLANVEDGLALLSKTCSSLVLIGQSMGGMVALSAAARFELHAVVTLSTPYFIPPRISLIDWMRILVQPMVDKHVKRFPITHPLNRRRELDYPAYPEVPSRIELEVKRLVIEMVASLPKVIVPALLIHSKADPIVPFACMQSIYDHLGSSQKQMLAFEGMGHSLVRDPLSQSVFDAILAFLTRLGNPA